MYAHLISLQKKLAKRVIIASNDKEISVVSGVDVSFSKENNLSFCAIVVMNRYFEILEIKTAHRKINLPYIPGLLSFRELPVIFQAYKQLTVKPDIFLMDSQGIAHPRKLGLASHFGVVFNVPSIGCAKSRLVGEYEEPCRERGCYEYLFFKNEKVGVVLRTKTGVKPLFVSPGHLIDIQDSMKIVLNYTTKYKLPEPTRLAHIEAEKYKRKIIKEL